MKARLEISMGLLLSALHLPEDVVVVHASLPVSGWTTHGAGVLELIIDHPSLPEPAPGEQLPLVQAELATKGYTRYWVGTGGHNEPGLLLILDGDKQLVVARSSESARPLVEELVNRANRSTECTEFLGFR